MRATILPEAIILTTARRASFSMMALGCIFNTQPYSYLCNYDTIFSYTDKREVLQQEYSQPQYFPLLTSGG